MAVARGRRGTAAADAGAGRDQRHAIEARIYAEDPARDFLPAAGRIAHLRLPTPSAHVRIDTGVREGDEIGVHYDPMIAKLICWDLDRPSALRRLRAALADYQVAGLTTNLSFLAAVTAHRAFAQADREPGLLDTGLIERYRAELLPEATPASDRTLAVAVLSELMRIDEDALVTARASTDPWSPWNLRDGWRLNEDNHHTFVFQDAGREVSVTAHYRRNGLMLELPGSRLLARETFGDGGRRRPRGRSGPRHGSGRGELTVLRPGEPSAGTAGVRDGPG